MSNCELCKYTDHDKERFIIKHGAKILFLSNYGTPFTGKESDIIAELCKTYELDLRNINFMSSIRCFMGKKDTGKEGLKHCRPTIIKAIQHLNPEWVVCFGDLALRQLLKKSKIMSARGRVFTTGELPNAKVFVTIHPNSILNKITANYPYIPVEKMNMRERILFNDFRLFKEAMNGSVGLETKGYRRIRQSDMDRLLKTRVVSTDTETNSADCKHPLFKPLSVAFSIKPHESLVAVLPTEIPIKEVIENPDITKIVASRPFDENVFKSMGMKPKGTFIDILPMAHVLDETSYNYNVETVVNHYTKLNNIKDLAEGMRHDLDKADERLLIRYNGVDTDGELQSYLAMRNIYKAEPELARYYSYFLQPVQDMFSDIWGNGIKIDTERLRANENELLTIKADLEQQCLDQIPVPLREKYKNNLNSRPLMVEFVFTNPSGLRLTPHRAYVTAKTKEPQISEDHFNQLRPTDFLQNYIAFKKVDKLVGTYVKRYWECIKGDSYIYPTTLHTRTATGRTVVKDPEMQTTPKRGEYAHYIRSTITCDEDEWLGSRDLSQSELRIAGWLANDPNIMKALKEHRDLHENTAREVVGPVLGISEITSDLRQKAKPVNFGFIYKQTPEGFQRYARDEYGIEFTVEECAAFQAAFFARPNGYYMIPVLHAHQIGEAREKGYVRSVLGRRRHLPRITAYNKWERFEAERQAVNSPIQTFSSDLGALAMMLFHKEIQSQPRLRTRIKPMLFIHDEILFRSKRDYMEKAQTILKDCMNHRTVEYIKKYFKTTVGYPVESDGKFGPRWSEMQKSTI